MLGSVALFQGFGLPWNPRFLWLRVLSESLIALAYLLIPFALARVVRGRKELPFKWIYFCFAAFAVSRGLTLAMDVGTLGHPISWVSGILRACTAAISLVALVVLLRVSPAILAIPGELADRRFKELIEDAPDAILQVDSLGKIVIANRTAEKMFGYTREELLGSNVDRLVPMGNRAAHPKHRDGFVDSGTTRAMGHGMGDLHARRKDGTELSVEIALSRVQTADGVHVTAAIRDVTDRKRIEKELDRAAVQLNSLLESTAVCVLAMDSAWEVHFVNGNAKTLLKARGNMLGMTLWEAFPVDKAATRELLMRVMETRLPASYEKYYAPLDLSVSVQAHPWENGGVAIFFTDISAQKRLERELESANSLLTSVLENTELGLFAVDSEWKFQYFNDHAKKTLHAEGKMLGTDMWALFPEQQPATREKLLQAMATRVPTSFDSYYEPLDLSTHVSVHPWEGGGLTVYFTDISPHKRLERELDSVNRRAASVLENTSVGIYAVDKNWVFQYVNEDAKRILKRRDLLGKGMWDSFPEIVPNTAELFWRAMSTRAPSTCDSYYAPLDLWTHLSVHPWDDGGITVCFSDISPQKRLERELEVERVQRNQRLEVLARLSSGLAHEIKNPLAIIHARASDLAELAEEGEVDRAEIAKTCASIVDTSDRAIRILRGVAAMARVGTHDPMREADVAEMVQQAVELVRGRYRASGIQLKTDVPARLPTLECREVQISQILVNLLNNAFDAVDGDARSDRWVRVVVSMQPGAQHENDIDRLEISVIDGGPGVAPEHRERLMQTFFTTKSMGAGIGIGLSVSRTIAEDHGGQLELRDCEGHTCFTLTLPVKAGRPEEVAA